MIKKGQEFYVMNSIDLLDKTDYIAHKHICTKIIERDNDLPPWIEHDSGGTDSRLCYPSLESVHIKLKEIQQRKQKALEGKIKQLEQQLENISQYNLEIWE